MHAALVAANLPNSAPLRSRGGVERQTRLAAGSPELDRTGEVKLDGLVAVKINCSRPPRQGGMEAPARFFVSPCRY